MGRGAFQRPPAPDEQLGDLEDVVHQVREVGLAAPLLRRLLVEERQQGLQDVGALAEDAVHGLGPRPGRQLLVGLLEVVQERGELLVGLHPVPQLRHLQVLLPQPPRPLVRLVLGQHRAHVVHGFSGGESISAGPGHSPPLAPARRRQRRRRRRPGRPPRGISPSRQGGRQRPPCGPELRVDAQRAGAVLAPAPL